MANTPGYLGPPVSSGGGSPGTSTKPTRGPGGGRNAPPSYKKGGRVKKTGTAHLHAGEVVKGKKRGRKRGRMSGGRD